jgi:hypothetical protein
MKKIHKLKLSRETLRHLDDTAIRHVAGGATDETCSNCNICRTDDPCCACVCDAGPAAPN